MRKKEKEKEKEKGHVGNFSWVGSATKRGIYTFVGKLRLWVAQ